MGLIELALSSTAEPGWPRLARGFQRVFDAMPWKGDPTFAVGDGRCADRRPTRASRPVSIGRMFLQENEVTASFASERGMIYCRELGETAALLAASG